MSVCHNAVDRHVANGKGDQVALVHDSPLTDTVRKITYSELQDQVSIEIQKENNLFCAIKC
jgi:propionyl-CoA synthetase